MKKLSISVPALLALMALPLIGQAQFAPVVSFFTGSNSNPQGIVAADVNGDGKLDLLTANQGTDAVGVLLNTTAAGATTINFAPVTTFSTSSGNMLTGVATADVNGDGKPDLLTSNYYYDVAGVLLNTTATGATTPTFAPVVTFFTGTGGHSNGIATADVNGDGKPDLLTVNFGTNAAAVLLNITAAGAATPRFAPVAMFSIGSNSYPYGIAVADINGDGKPDLLTANTGVDAIGVLLNTTTFRATTPSFAPVVAFSTGTGSAPQNLAAADVNGDGKPDLLTTNQSTNAAGVLLNTTTTGAATPSFAPVAMFSTGAFSAPVSIAAADINGDGKPDLLTANYYADAVGVLSNTTAVGAATPTFAPVAAFSTGNSSRPVSITAADVNGDGWSDLLTANVGGYTAGILLNTGAALATASAAPLAPAHIWPNPAHDHFTLTLPAVAGATTATAVLLNALGQVLNTRPLALAATGTTVAYAPAGLAAGVYALRVQAGSQTTTLRLVVE